MSITFTAATIADDGSIAIGFACPTCNDHRDRLATITDYDSPAWDAEFDQWDAHKDHGDCVNRHEVNLSNANAAAVLARLGVTFDHCGTIDPDDLLGRAMVANIGADDTGTAAVTDVGALGCTTIDCGVPAGYFAARFDGLAELAVAAKAAGAVIGWC